MKKYINFRKCAVICFAILAFTGCKKFLDEKQDNSFTVPQSLGDLQMLLDNYTSMNTGYPSQGELAADNYYLATADYNALTDNSFKNYYTWQADDMRVTEWSSTYRTILYANTVLDEYHKFIETADDQVTANKIRGAALFFRANAFYLLAQAWAPVYDSSNAASSFGIPLRVSADIGVVSTRATVKEVYDRIIADAKEAAGLLDTVKPYPNRPTRQAAFGLLARTYLSMGAYQEAKLYADSALTLGSTLINFNSLNANSTVPFARFNAEVVFPAISAVSVVLTPARAKVDSNLLRSYHINDLRRTLFFRLTNGNYVYKGDYNASNNGTSYVGLTRPELYLIKAEAEARLGAGNHTSRTTPSGVMVARPCAMAADVEVLTARAYREVRRR